MTFDPHPMKVLAPEAKLKQIQTTEQKIAVLKTMGVDLVLIIPFTLELAQCSARDFATQILSETLKVKELYVGTGFAFGKGRQGNVQLLEKIGSEKGFKVGRIDEITFRNMKVSSSAIRQLLLDGRVSFARRLLNRYYSINGTVVSGHQLGSKLGFPTANIESENEIVPKFGVYVTHVLLNGKRYRSVTNIGVRPTFASEQPRHNATIEAYVFDLDETLYGRRVGLDFCLRLRDERKFASKEDLVAQIKKDIALANKYFDRLERRYGCESHQGRRP